MTIRLLIALALVALLAAPATALIVAPPGGSNVKCINNCSGAVETGNDSVIKITTASAASPMTFNFSSAWGAAPVCVGTNNTTAGAFVETISTTTAEFIITTAITPGSSDVFTVLCFGP